MNGTERGLVLSTLARHERTGLDGSGRSVCRCGWVSRLPVDVPHGVIGRGTRRRLEVAALLGGKVWTTDSPDPEADRMFRQHLIDELQTVLLDEPAARAVTTR